jgi:ketosteroid isomerase-like protein
MRRVFEGWKRRDFEALLELTHPDIFAQVVLPPGEAKRAYRGREEILAFLHDGDDKYEQFEAEPRTFTVGPTGRVLAEGSVSYKGRDSGGIASVAYWVCEVRDGKIVWWESFSERADALQAAGLTPPAGPAPVPTDSPLWESA